MSTQSDETIQSAGAETSVLRVVELELKRHLDRKVVPAMEELLWMTRFCTSVSLSHVSADIAPSDMLNGARGQAAEGQSEILLVHYHLSVEQASVEGVDWDQLWDKATDRFYGFDDEAGVLLNMREVAEFLVGLSLEGFQGMYFHAFRERQSGILMPSSDWETAEAARSAKREARRPVAVAEGGDCLPVALTEHGLKGMTIGEQVRVFIAVCASRMGLPPVDPDKITDKDVVYELMDRNDKATRTARKSIEMHHGLVGSFTIFGVESIPVTVENYIQLIEDYVFDEDEGLIVMKGPAVSPWF